MARLVKIYETDIGDSYRKRKETYEEGDIFYDILGEQLMCCGNGCVIHNPAELGGYCSGGEPLCKSHAALFCSLCDNLTCAKHSIRCGERVVCNRHGFFRLLAFSVFAA